MFFLLSCSFLPHQERVTWRELVPFVLLVFLLGMSCWVINRIQWNELKKRQVDESELSSYLFKNAECLAAASAQSSLRPHPPLCAAANQPAFTPLPKRHFKIVFSHSRRHWFCFTSHCNFQKRHRTGLYFIRLLEVNLQPFCECSRHSTSSTYITVCVGTSHSTYAF